MPGPETIKEVEVIKEVPVPGPERFVDREVIKEVAVPGPELIKEVEVQGGSRPSIEYRPGPGPIESPGRFPYPAPRSCATA